MKTYLPVAAAVLVMLVGGYAQGVWSGRWGEFPELALFSKQLNEIPMQVGEWKGEAQQSTDAETLKVAGAEGELVRTYTNPEGQKVMVSIICGRLQDVTYHTPDRCYPAAGFEMQRAPESKVFELPDGPAEFMTTSFLKSEPTGSHTEVGYWSWSGDGTWKTPSNPKFEFASHQHALFKLYVFAAAPPSKQGSTNPQYCEDFIREFVPAFGRAMRPALVEVGRIDADAEAPAPGSTSG